MHKATSGFTIVELLIVIVVIAILSTVSTVAYSGVQNRANDSAIQSDLNNFAKKVQLIAAEAGEFPAGGTTRAAGIETGNPTLLPGFTFRPSKQVYMTTANNLFYCTGTETASGQTVFGVAARSKSGNTFKYGSSTGILNLGNVVAGPSTACQGISEPYTRAYGYYSGTPEWWTWTNG